MGGDKEGKYANMVQVMIYLNGNVYETYHYVQ